MALISTGEHWLTYSIKRSLRNIENNLNVLFLMDQLCVRYWTTCFVNVIMANPYHNPEHRGYHFIDEKIEAQSG